MTELKPCPFCGGVRAEVKHSSRWGYFVSCACTAVGPGMTTRAAAVSAWNLRREPRQMQLGLGLDGER